MGEMAGTILMKKLTSLLAAVFLFATSAWAIDIPALVRKARPAVVQVGTFNQAGELTKTGTGFFISADGLLLTNYHVTTMSARVLSTIAFSSDCSCAGTLNLCSVC